MRTLVALEGRFFNADGTSARGTICATPSDATDFNEEGYTGQPICGLLDADGRVTAQSGRAMELFATDDVGAQAFDYTFTVQLDGEDLVEFKAALPKASTASDSSVATTLDSATVILTDLVVSDSMLSQLIVGANWPSATTVLGMNSTTNALTLSALATATGSCSATVGGAANYEDLLAAKL
jgi:hypothetical protein